MLFDDLCLKIYFWPFLSYLASIKGLCPFYPDGLFPATTPPPTTAPPTTSTTTLPPCPPDPYVCLPGGERPIPNCPCIDPRQQSGVTTAAEVTTSTTTMPLDSWESLRFRLDAPNPSIVLGNDMLIFSTLDNSPRIRMRKKRKILREKFSNDLQHP